MSQYDELKWLAESMAAMGNPMYEQQKEFAKQIILTKSSPFVIQPKLLECDPWVAANYYAGFAAPPDKPLNFSDRFYADWQARVEWGNQNIPYQADAALRARARFN